MSGDFDSEVRTEWQRRWMGVANRLEGVLENNAYRFALGAATVALVVTYAIIASRMAEPARWIPSPYIAIHESVELDFLDTDALNRSMARLGKLASILNLKPQKLVLKPTADEVREPFAVETHVLRLWLDEARGFGPDGMYVVVSDAVAKAIVATVFPDKRLFAKLPNPDSNWFGHVKTMGQSCSQDEGFKKNPICSFVKERDETPNPLSLSNWFASQMVAEARMYNAGSRIAYLRQIARLSSIPDLVAYERVSNWPPSASKFGPVTKAIVSTLAPRRAKVITFKPYVPLIMIDLEKQGAVRDETSTGLLVISSCSVPTLGSLLDVIQNFAARDVVWARACAQGLVTRRGVEMIASAAEFASANSRVPFVQIGAGELRAAIARNWVQKDLDILSFVAASRERAASPLIMALRTQAESWNGDMQAFRMKAPLEVVKLVRTM